MIAVGQSVRCIRMEIRQIMGNGPIASRLLRSLKVVGTDTDQSGTRRGFALVNHSNHGRMGLSSYHFLLFLLCVMLSVRFYNK